LNARIYIGTSGRVYKEWANDFYRGIKPAGHFAHYATQFPTVEINATFYHLPQLAVVHNWRKKAPEILFLPSKAAATLQTSNAWTTSKTRRAILSGASNH